jgi:hypothetical protein
MTEALICLTIAVWIIVLCMVACGRRDDDWRPRL